MSRTIVAVYATDWGIISEQVPTGHDFAVTVAWVVGLLVKETDDMFVIAHEWFDDGEVRFTTTLPKGTVKQVRRWELNEEPPQP